MDATQFVNELTKWLVDNASSFVFIVVSSLLTFFASWYTARYSWKAQKADERRQRVYAPLYDELSNLKMLLAPYGPFDTKEYNQISSAHLLYLVPKSLELRIHDLYRTLRLVDAKKAELYQKYERQILEQINAQFKNPVSNDQEANSLAKDLAICAFQGEIVNGWENGLERAFQGLDSRYQKMGRTTLKEFLREFLDSISKDADQIELNNLKAQALTLIDSIQDSIKGDLKF